MSAGVSAALLLGALLADGIPFVFYKTGIGQGYHLGAFRWGRAEYSRGPFILSDQFSIETVGYVFGRAGEQFRLTWHVSISDGDVTLVVDKFLGVGADPVWKQVFTAGSAGDVAGEVIVPLESTGLYSIRMTRWGWGGDVRFRWSVGDRPDLAALPMIRRPLPVEETDSTVSRTHPPTESGRS